MNNETKTERDKSEIWLNPLNEKDFIIVAPARGRRPRKKDENRVPRDTRQIVDSCVFCRGNESLTPPTIMQVTSGKIEGCETKKDWEIRVMANKFQILSPDGDVNGFTNGTYSCLGGHGDHLVVVDHWNHSIRLHEMDTQHLVNLMRMHQELMKNFYRDERIKYVLTFKNVGPASGGSVEHSHSQLIAFPLVPEIISNEIERAEGYYQKNKQCIFCRFIEDTDNELAFNTFDNNKNPVVRTVDMRKLVIERSEKFIAIKPLVGKFDWEVHILPLVHSDDFLKSTSEDLADLVLVLKRTMERLNTVLDGVQYNLLFYTAPRDVSCGESFHWHIRICPRTSIPSGLEIATGLSVDIIDPLYAAEQLRNVKLG